MDKFFVKAALAAATLSVMVAAPAQAAVSCWNPEAATAVKLKDLLDEAEEYCRADLLVIDDFAVLAMDPAQANHAFQVISERYEYRRSTAITTNRLFKDWPKVFPDALNAQVIAERFTERAERFIMDGKGYRPNKATT